MTVLKILFGSLAVCLVAFVALTTFLEPMVAAGVAYDPLVDEPLNCSEFFDLLETRYTTKTLLTSYSHITEPYSERDSVLVVMGPTEPFTFAEQDALANFMGMGGTLILLADNGGTGHTLELSVGESPYYTYYESGYYSDYKISPVRLRDLESFEKRPDFVLLENFADHPMVDNVSSILTNYPTAIATSYGGWSTSNNRVGEDIAWTSSRSFLDENGDNIRNAEEPAGPFSVIAVKEVGDGGHLVLIADPGIFVNDMIDRANNRQFATSLFDWATENGSKPVIFDLTHGGYAPAGWVGAVGHPAIIFLTPAILFIIAIGVVMAIAWRRKIRARLPRKIWRGRFSRGMKRYQKRMRSVTKTNLNEPLMVYYELFLEKCAKAFRLKEKDEMAILKRIKARYPKYYRQLEGTINVCGQVRAGARDIRSADALKRLVRKMSKFEKELGVKG